MLNLIDLEKRDRGLREAEVLLEDSFGLLPSRILTGLERLSEDLTTNIGVTPHNDHLKHTPLSLSGVVEDHFASNVSLLSSRHDLSWVPQSFEKFCEYLQPSKFMEDRDGNPVLDYKPFDYQLALVNELEKKEVKTVNVYKSRQTGLSELIISYILFKFLSSAKHNDQYSVLVYSMTQKDATALGDRMLQMYDKLIRGIELEDGRIIKGPDFDRDSTTEKTLNGGTNKINFMATTGGRGSPSVDLVVVDESDFIPEIDRILKAAKPSLAGKGGKIITITTPNGEAGYAYKAMNSIDGFTFDKTIEQCKAEEGLGWGIFSDKKNANVGVVVHYSAHPKYDSNWAETMKAEMQYDDASWDQEYELSTITSGSLFFNYKDVEYCYQLTSKLETDYRNITIAIDPSGSGKDYTAIVVWGQRKSDGKKILIEEIYDQKIGAIATADEAWELFHKYQPSCFCVETNGVGDTVHELVQNKLDGLCDVNRIHTSASSKIGILQLMRSEMSAQRVGYRESTNFRKELANFQQKEKSSGKFSYEARPGFHDDAIMASCIALNQMVNNPEPLFISML